jgi:hypothetical protein
MMLKKLVILVLSLTALSGHAEIKNQQKVLDGLLVRAGVMGQRPLTDSELLHLCEQGFGHAYSLYGPRNKSIECSRGVIHYSGSKDFRTPGDMNRILEDIRSGLSSKQKTFVHCNNGAHASGFVAAIVLRTFCGMSAEKAISYWQSTLNGYPLQEPNRTSLMNRIRNYPIRQDLELSAGEKQAFGCPM